MDAFDPYDTLGVARDADPAAIKRAHRKRVKETHPDKGGKREEFEKVTRALTILLDADKRARYDRDGTVNDDPVNANAGLQLVGEFITAWASAHPDLVESTDIIAEAQKLFKQQLASYEDQKRQHERKLKALDKAIARLKRKDGKHSILHDALKNAVAANRQTMGSANRQIENIKLALTFLDEYSYEFERQKQPSDPYAAFARPPRFWTMDGT